MTTPKSRCFLASALKDAIEDLDFHSFKRLIEDRSADPTFILPLLGFSPFHLAIGSENNEFAVNVVRLILRRGYDPNVKSNDGLTPLHIAASYGRMEVVKLLLAFGGDPELVDSEDYTPFEYAYRENYRDIIEVMKQHIFYPIDICDVEGSCAYTTRLSNITIESCGYALEIPIKQKLELPLVENVSTLPVASPQEYVQNWCLAQSKTFHDLSLHDDSNAKIPIAEKPISLSDGSLSSSPNDVTHSLNLLQLNSQSLRDSKIWNGPVVQPTRKISRESGIATIPDSSLASSSEPEVVPAPSGSDYCTCASSEVHDVNGNGEDAETSGCSYGTAYEVYLIEDPKAGVVYKEKRYLKNGERFSNILPQDNECIDDVTLRKELLSLGFEAGPVTHTTRKLYVNKLYELKTTTQQVKPLPNRKKVYSVELETTLRNPALLFNSQYQTLEDEMCEAFRNPDPKKRWREGTKRMSFNYLLLDPRITNNLPAREKSLTFEEKWKIFLSSIFYVGKGKLSRPYEHLNEAMSLWKDKREAYNKKLNRILKIWGDNLGVVCVQVFHHVIAEEAFTREAAIIKTLKLENLCNQKHGEFYKVCATWPERDRKKLGANLLYKAMQVYFIEGERQLCPESLC